MGSQMSMSGKLLLSFICSWYSFKEVPEEINKFLEFVLEERENLPLILSISTSESKWVIDNHRLFAEEYENYIFATSLIGTTIQDRDKRKRSNRKNWNI